MHSYLKVIDDSSREHVMFYFDDRVKENTVDAYVEALTYQVTNGATPTTLSMWRPPLNAGPWDDLPLVGHRPKESIETDLLAAQQRDDVPEMELRLEELTMLTSRYSRRGQS